MKHNLDFIPPGMDIFIDANIFLFAFWGQQPLAQICGKFLQRIKNFDLHRAKEVRRDYGLMTNDSVIVGVMRGEELRHLATYDAGFARVPDVQVWMPQIDE